MANITNLIDPHVGKQIRLPINWNFHCHNNSLLLDTARRSCLWKAADRPTLKSLGFSTAIMFTAPVTCGKD